MFDEVKFSVESRTGQHRLGVGEGKKELMTKLGVFTIIPEYHKVLI